MSPLAPISLSMPPSGIQGLGGSSNQALDNNYAKSFSTTLSEAFDSLNSLQNKAGEMSMAYATHQSTDLHSVMIASEQASVAIQLATQVRNKVVDAYQEVMRITM